jgi:hypothetical protein
MNFGDAIEALKDGKKVFRTGWNGKGMWISLFSSLNIGIENDDNSVDFNIDDEYLGEKSLHHWGHYENDKVFKIKDCFCMFTAGEVIQLGWNASTPDILAEDWEVVD